MEEIVLARHGESEYSVRGAMNGDPGTAVRLTEAGRGQARRLGELLAGERIELCVTSEFGRTTETADLALAGRDVPRLVVPELNDVRVGDFEGGSLAEYRVWAGGHDPLTVAPGGGESRAETVHRYVRAWRLLLARPEERILVVAHGLPIRYVLNAARGDLPAPLLEPVEYAHAYRLSAAELEDAAARLDAWAAEPAWHS
jgi:broad specificity phosphatase PhoE